MSYKNFLGKFRISNVNVVRDRGYETINYGSSYINPASYYTTNREELIEMEITRTGFEDLVKLDEEFTRQWQDQRDEEWLRRSYPALKDAYEKYKMLLELYK